MTTKEAVYVAKLAAKRKKILISYNGIEVTNITTDDLQYADMYVGIYTRYNIAGEAMYSMCVKDVASGAYYQCNIKELEILK